MPMQFCQASSRFVTRASGITTWHGFSFGAHYDPARVGFGALIAHNDERLSVGSGYPDHPHAETEILTYVLSGALRHTSSVGSAELGPGSAQRLSAGAGVVHSEVSVAGEETRFIQAWVRPSTPNLEPSYACDVVSDDDPVGDELVCVAGPGGLSINAAASLWVASLPAGGAVSLPDSPRLHVFGASGRMVLGDHALTDGDSAHLIDEGARSLSAEVASLALIWALDL